jgi:hypothetical protein
MKKLLLLSLIFFGTSFVTASDVKKPDPKKLKKAKILQNGLKAVATSLNKLADQDTNTFAESDHKTIACNILKGLFGKIRIQIPDPENPGEMITESKTLIDIIKEDYFSPGEMTKDQELKLDLVAANTPIALRAFGC